MASTTPTPSSTKVTIWATIIAFFIANWSYILLVAGSITGVILTVDHFKDQQAITELHKLSAWTDSVSNSKIKTWTDKYGAEHARAENLAVHDAAMADYADSVAKLLKVKPSQIYAISNLEGNTAINATPTIDSTETTKVPCGTDTIKVTEAFDFHYTDAWTHIIGRVGLGAVNNIQVDMTDTLKRTDYWDRKWFLGSKTYYSDLTNSNPHDHITGYKGVQLAGETENAKQWSVGPAIGVGYGPGSAFNKPSFWFGVSVQYSLFKF